MIAGEVYVLLFCVESMCLPRWKGIPFVRRLWLAHISHLRSFERCTDLDVTTIDFGLCRNFVCLCRASRRGALLPACVADESLC
jgi:hypothetical protein